MPRTLCTADAVYSRECSLLKQRDSNIAPTTWRVVLRRSRAPWKTRYYVYRMIRRCYVPPKNSVRKMLAALEFDHGNREYQSEIKEPEPQLSFSLSLSVSHVRSCLSLPLAKREKEEARLCLDAVV